MLTTAFPSTKLPTGAWVVDPDHTTIEFRVKHVGLARVRGVFHRFDGTLAIGEDGEMSASGTIDAASLDTRVAARDDHLRSADFFDVDNHPQITFSATSIEKVGEEGLRIVGDLTIRGVTRSVELSGEILGIGVDDEGAERVGLDIAGVLDRRDFGLTWNKAVDGGGLLVGNRVDVRLEVSAVRRPSAAGRPAHRKEPPMSVTPLPTGAHAVSVGRRYVNPVVKDAATFLENTSERTLIEIELAPGGGNTPHRHRTYAEHFMVRDGRLTVVVDGVSHELAPGEDATAPMMSLHHFANPTGERTVFRVDLRPGHPGFEKAIRVAYGLARDGRTNEKAIPRNPLHTALILAWSDMLVPGPLSFRPVLKALVKLARALGVERALERRYPPPAGQ